MLQLLIIWALIMFSVSFHILIKIAFKLIKYKQVNLCEKSNTRYIHLYGYLYNVFLNHSRWKSCHSGDTEEPQYNFQSHSFHPNDSPIHMLWRTSTNILYMDSLWYPSWFVKTILRYLTKKYNEMNSKTMIW